MNTCQSSYRRGWRWLALIALVVIGSGCARSCRSVPSIHLPAEASAPSLDSPDVATVDPVYHLVRPGQTLWWISRKYGVTVEELVSTNALADADKLSVDQIILIPGARVGEWSWPVPGREILSSFGVKRGAHRHRGIDIRGKKGQQVRAVRAGRVVSSSRMQGYGKTVVVDHGDGLRSLYAHNSTILVEPGEPVRRGQPIARVGRTGNASTYHCHLEIRRGKVPINPLRYLNRN